MSFVVFFCAYLLGTLRDRMGEANEEERKRKKKRVFSESEK